MNKITHIVATTSNEMARVALLAVFAPFGSLMSTEGDGVTLAELLLTFLKERQLGAKAGIAEGIMHSLWSAATDDFARIDVHPQALRLTTPNSRTLITISRHGYNNSTEVIINFGPEGSATRAREVLEKLIAQGVMVAATAGGKLVTYQQTVEFVLDYWRTRLQDLDEHGRVGCDRDYVTERIDFFSKPAR